MAVYYPYPVKGACGHSFTAQLARGINIRRTPELKKKIIDGLFHRVTCPVCGHTFTVEKEFSYTDFDTNTFIKVMPAPDRHLWKQASKDLTAEVRAIPDELAPAKKRTLRVVFGLAELREKIIAQEYGLDDRLAELMKVLLIHEHPFLIQRSRLRIHLDAVNDTAIQFVASYDHDKQCYRIGIPRDIVDNFLGKQEEVKSWVNRSHPCSNIFHLKDDHWMNFWRWSPQPGALDLLHQYAQQVEAGKKIDVAGKDFQQMLSFIPKGNHLPAWAKKDVTTLFNYAKANNLQKLEDALFEIRFDKILDDDWYLNNDPDDIDTIWKLLKDLPETNVEGNSFINDLQLDSSVNGGYYEPSSRSIVIGATELSDKERFEDVVRHEVGHAVHELKKAAVDPWLTSHFGWQTFETSNTDIDKWVELMGGWGNVSPLEQSQVRTYLTEALGPGSRWESGSTPIAPSSHAWNRPDFGPRLAFERTGANWYLNFESWYQFNGKAFFLNYWYKTLCAVDIATLQLVHEMPSSYAAMSHFEFFAELYALYYDADDPAKKVIPADVAQWLNTNTAQDHPVMPASFIVPEKAFDWTRRPA